MAKQYLEDVISTKANVETPDGEKPGVVLVGDSIKGGYCTYAKKYLTDVAEVRWHEENAQYTQFTFVNIRGLTNHFENEENVKVIVWNNGHWDIGRFHGSETSLNTVELYTEMLEKIYKTLKNLYPKAKIVFQTTSPVNPDGFTGLVTRTREDIEKYNKAAVETLSKYDILIDDVYELLKDEPASLYADYCHLTEEGFEKLGKHVADYVRKLL